MNITEAPQHPKLFLDKGTLDQWNNNRYEIFTSPNKGIRIVILGEVHQRQQHEQMDLIRIIQPSYFLHESLGAWIYNPQIQKFIRPKNRLFDNIEDQVSPITIDQFLSLSNELKFKIIGCDLTDAEIMEAGKRLCVIFPQKYQYEEHHNAIRRIENPHYDLIEDLGLDENIMSYRNRQMVKTITKYEALSKKPIVVVMGGLHGNTIHENMLQRKHFGYAYVKQYGNV